MDKLRVTEGEYRFCLILWENEPIKSTELVRLCEAKLGWKETTTYTVIKRLIGRGIVKNERTIVSALVSKEEIQAAELDDLVERTFEGSLPAVVAAFTKHQKLTGREIDEIQAMIDSYRRRAKHD